MFALAVLALMGAPDIGCSLVVDGADVTGGVRLEKGTFRAAAFGRAAYELTHGAARVRSLVRPMPGLASLTWRPPGAATATHTCTSSPVVRGGPSGPAAVFCVLPGGRVIAGLGTVRAERAGRTYSASAVGTELRVSAEGPDIGFVAVWSDRQPPTVSAAWLEAGGETLTCWRM